MTHDKLNSLLNKIEQNIRPKNKSKIKFYTTHSYKGMEAQNIRLANDINMSEQEIYYVSITRGMNKNISRLTLIYYMKRVYLCFFHMI